MRETLQSKIARSDCVRASECVQACVCECACARACARARACVCVCVCVCVCLCVAAGGESVGAACVLQRPRSCFDCAPDWRLLRYESMIISLDKIKKQNESLPSLTEVSIRV